MAGTSIGPGPHGLHFTLAVPGAEPLSVALSRFADEVTDFRPFWEGPFKTSWYAGRMQAFALGGEPGGELWAPLSEGYRQWKARRFPGAGTLVRTGRMKAALTSPTATGAIWRPSQNALEVGANITSRDGFSYPTAHQLGTRRMPARPPLHVSSLMLQALMKDLQKFVVKRWQERRRLERLADKGIVITNS